MRKLLLTRSQWQTMRTHVQACAPMEACGLLAGTRDSVREVYLVRNQEQSRVRFRMDASEQLRAFNSMEAEGLDLIGIFHSHPGQARVESLPASAPSPTDIDEAAYPVVQVIWSRADGEWRARGFWIEDGKVSEVPLRVTDGE